MGKRKTTEQFIKEARKLHGDKYDYSITEHINCKENVKIICQHHGVFEVIADNHIRKAGCKTCKKEESLKNRFENFIEKAKEKHKNKYDYSEVNYINNTIKVIIICPVHGKFEQTPLNHLQGNGCDKCGIQKIKDSRTKLDDFIIKANEVHDCKYSYENVEFINMITPVKIKCKKHGDFYQKPYVHISNKRGCQKCGIEKISKSLRSNTESFIEKAKLIHGNRYGYDFVKYLHSRDKVKIFCDVHGIFEQTPSTHLKGSGCQKCANLINVYKKEDYVKLSKTAILYLVLMEYGDERFYKIGKTKNTVLERLNNNVSIYTYSVIGIYEDFSDVIFDMEIEMHKKYDRYKYIPKKWFAGYTECYSTELPIEDLWTIL